MGIAKFMCRERLAQSVRRLWQQYMWDVCVRTLPTCIAATQRRADLRDFKFSDLNFK